VSLADVWGNLAPQVTTFLGDETVTLARPSSLVAIEPDGAPGELVAASSAAAGASSLSLRLPDGGKLLGILLAGARLVIGGVTYVLAADAGSGIAFTAFSATLTEPLAADVALGASITVLPEALFTFEHCQVSRRRRHDLAVHLQETFVATVTIPTKGAPTAPRLNDVLTLADGTVGRVSAPGGGAAGFWKVVIGA